MNELRTTKCNLVSSLEQEKTHTGYGYKLNVSQVHSAYSGAKT